MGRRRGAGRCFFPREAEETAKPGPIDGVVPIDDMVGAFDEGGSRSMLSCYDESARVGWCNNIFNGLRLRPQRRTQLTLGDG